MGEREQIAELASALIAWSGDVSERPLEATEARLGSAITGPMLDWLQHLATAPPAEVEQRCALSRDCIDDPSVKVCTSPGLGCFGELPECDGTVKDCPSYKPRAEGE